MRKNTSEDVGVQRRGRRSGVRRAFLAGAVVATTLTALTACGLAGGGSPSGDSGGDAATFYKGKTIDLIIPYGPGGSNDATARFIAPLLSKHVPGNPRVQVVNVDGGGTVIGSNQFQRKPHDGMTWFVGGSNVTFQDIFKNPNAEYSVSDWTALMGFPQGQIAYGSTSLGIKSADELPDAKEPIVLSTQDTEGASLIHVLALQLLGVDFKVVSGYADTGAKRIAILSGEANVNGESTLGYLQYDEPDVQKGNVIPLYSFGFPNADGGLDRDPAAPDIPTIAEVYEAVHGKQPSGPEWDLYMGLVKANSNMQKAFYLHADDPKAAFDAVEQGIKDMQEDPDYKSGIDKVLEGYTPIFGDELAAQYKTVVNPPAGFADNAIAYRQEITDAVGGDGTVKGLAAG